MVVSNYESKIEKDWVLKYQICFERRVIIRLFKISYQSSKIHMSSIFWRKKTSLSDPSFCPTRVRTDNYAIKNILPSTSTCFNENCTRKKYKKGNHVAVLK